MMIKMSPTLNIIPDDDSFADFMTFNPETRDSANRSAMMEPLFPSKQHKSSTLKSAMNSPLKQANIIAQSKSKFPVFSNNILVMKSSSPKRLLKRRHYQETPVCSILLKNDQIDPQFENDLGSKIMNNKDIRSVSFYSSVIENFENMISSIKMIVIVLVLSAALLAFVVLYNLSNVNISERMREIATIKVLGFNEKEVNAYVNRETIILALIGSLTGLLLGIYLHDLIMALAELDTIRFGRTIFGNPMLIPLP